MMKMMMVMLTKMMMMMDIPAGDSVGDVVRFLHSLIPVPSWRELTRGAQSVPFVQGIGVAAETISPGLPYVGLVLGGLLVLLPDWGKWRIELFLHRTLGHPLVQVRLLVSLVLFLMIIPSSLILVQAGLVALGSLPVLLVPNLTDTTMGPLGWWLLSCLILYLFVGAIWRHVLRIVFFILVRHSSSSL